jgi:hypothetical protein
MIHQADNIPQQQQHEVLYPRIHQLRMKQVENGIDISFLRLENCGLATVHFTHHISKLFEGKAESYRVRACRTCTKLSIPLDLGQYADLESAMIINDVHEILQGRTTQLHVLVPEDVAYLHLLTVRKRGGVKDIPVMVALEERARKNNANPRLNICQAIQPTNNNINNNNDNIKSNTNTSVNVSMSLPLSVPSESHNFYFARTLNSGSPAQDSFVSSSSFDTGAHQMEYRQYGSDIGSDTTTIENDTDMSEALDFFESLTDEDMNLFQSMDFYTMGNSNEPFDELFTW